MGKQGEEHKEHKDNNPPKSQSGIDTGIGKVREAFSEWLKLENQYIIDVALGVVVANSFEGDSLFLYLVGPPSSGKTEII